ncbi:MAG: T9SS type A sorting domain-containing protein [Flavobacteriales bacterium]|nr:T9SS type A sorting domain-containing protein [Flavobacteriales bacterium]
MRIEPTRLCTVLLILLAPILVRAQQVYKGFGTSNSTFLLGNLTALRTQCLYLPGDLVNPVSGPITRLYYRYGTTGQATGVTLGNLTIKLGLTNEVAFAGGNTYFTGLSTVLASASYTIPAGTTGDWFPIDLQTPFLYNSNRTLIIEIEFQTTTAAAFGTYGTTPNNGRKLYSNTSGTVTGTTTSSTWQDMGFDLDMGAGIAHVETIGAALWPNPASQILNIALPADLSGNLEFIDAQGRTVLTAYAQGAAAISIAPLASGPYTVRLTDTGRSIMLGRVLKE